MKSASSRGAGGRAGSGVERSKGSVPRLAEEALENQGRGVDLVRGRDESCGRRATNVTIEVVVSKTSPKLWGTLEDSGGPTRTSTRTEPLAAEALTDESRTESTSALLLPLSSFLERKRASGCPSLSDGALRLTRLKDNRWKALPSCSSEASETSRIRSEREGPLSKVLPATPSLNWPPRGALSSPRSIRVR